MHLVKTVESTSSHIGGVPTVPGEFDWPRPSGPPLAFLAQLDLEQLARHPRIDWLPNTGFLLFFYDMTEQPWGFDPKHGTGWTVLYRPVMGPPTERAAPPDLPADGQLRRANVTFRPVQTYPSALEGLADLHLTDREVDAFTTLQEARFEGAPQHQIGGHANPIQGDMELECQLVSNGLYCGDPSGYEDPRARTLEPGAHEWRLLLQLDTDDELNIMWGDCGRLYFWIRELDARLQRFDRTWVILQCS